jgi:hypothetical protein
VRRLWYMSPVRRMFLGFAVLFGAAVVTFFLTALAVVFVKVIGFLPTVFLYLSVVTAVLLARVAWKLQVLGHGFTTVREWDTDNADLEGSTARYGTPHDPYSFRSARRPHLDGRP